MGSGGQGTGQMHLHIPSQLSSASRTHQRMNRACRMGLGGQATGQMKPNMSSRMGMGGQATGQMKPNMSSRMGMGGQATGQMKPNMPSRMGLGGQATGQMKPNMPSRLRVGCITRTHHHTGRKLTMLFMVISRSVTALLKEQQPLLSPCKGLTMPLTGIQAAIRLLNALLLLLSPYIRLVMPFRAPIPTSIRSQEPLLLLPSSCNEPRMPPAASFPHSHQAGESPAAFAETLQGFHHAAARQLPSQLLESQHAAGSSETSAEHVQQPQMQASESLMTEQQLYDIAHGSSVLVRDQIQDPFPPKPVHEPPLEALPKQPDDDESGWRHSAAMMQDHGLQTYAAS